MPVELVIPKRLARYAQGQRSFQLEPGSLQELLESLCQQHPELRLRLLGDSDRLYPYLACMHNQQSCSASDLGNLKCSDGDRLEIVTLASGG